MFSEVKMDRISPKLPPAENLPFNMQILRSATVLPTITKYLLSIKLEMKVELAWRRFRIRRCPAGTDIMLIDFKHLPEESGFDFSAPNRGDVDLAKGCNIYFGFEDGVGVAYLYLVNGTQMQDMGCRDHFTDLDQSPVRVSTTGFVEILEGDIYAFYLPRKNLSKIQVKQVLAHSGTFDRALQIGRGNLELAPVLWR